MTAFLLAGTVVALLVGLVTLLVPPSARRRERLLVDVANEVGLRLTAEVEPQIVRRSRRTRLCTFLGGALGWGLSVWSPLYVGSSPTGFLIVMGGIALGGALGGLVSAVVDAHASIPAAVPRIARSRAVRTADYVSPIARWAGWACAVATSIGAVACAAAGVRDPMVLLALPLLVAGTAAIAEAGSRFVITRPQVATDALALTWDDALRAKNLTAVLDTAPLAAFYAGIAMVFALSDLHQAGLGWPLLALGVTLAPPAGWLILRLIRKQQIDQHYLHRLWPATTAALATARHSRP